MINIILVVITMFIAVLWGFGLGLLSIKSSRDDVKYIFMTYVAGAVTASIFLSMGLK